MFYYFIFNSQTIYKIAYLYSIKDWKEYFVLILTHVTIKKLEIHKDSNADARMIHLMKC